MKSMLISFGHAASHSPWFVHEPKYSSIFSTIASTRWNRSGWPCGSRLRCEILAPVNRFAAPLLFRFYQRIEFGFTWLMRER